MHLRGLIRVLGTSLLIINPMEVLLCEPVTAILGVVDLGCFQRYFIALDLTPGVFYMRPVPVPRVTQQQTLG